MGGIYDVKNLLIERPTTNQSEKKTKHLKFICVLLLIKFAKNPYNNTSSTDWIKMDFKLNNVVSMWKVREMVDKATNLVMNYTETESKVI